MKQFNILLLVLGLAFSIVSQSAPLSEGDLNSRAFNGIGEFLRAHPTSCFVGYSLSTEISTQTNPNLPSSDQIQAMLKKEKGDTEKVMAQIERQLAQPKAAPITVARTTAKLIYSENKKTYEELIFDLRQGLASDEAGTAHKAAVMSKFKDTNCSISVGALIKMVGSSGIFSGSSHKQTSD